MKRETKNYANKSTTDEVSNKRRKKSKTSDRIKRMDAFKVEGESLEKHDGMSWRKEKKRQALTKDLSKDNLLEKITEIAGEEVYQLSSGDEDCSKGMKKWIMTYHQSRPGIKVLQERIDNYIVSHEAEEEKARKGREAQVAEGGWEVVKHHKGGKKSTDTGSGIAVGSVSQTAVLDKMAKKKNKEASLDFYRFQRREAQKNEILMLQRKFEQDKKRIQQMRAARKFRPY